MLQFERAPGHRLQISLFIARIRLLNFLVYGVTVAVGAELFQLQPASCIATILSCGIARNPRGALISITAALSTLQGNHQTNALALSHSLKTLQDELNTNIHYFTRFLAWAKIFLIFRSKA